VFDVIDLRLIPYRFFATTVNVYDAPVFKPVMTPLLAVAGNVFDFVTLNPDSTPAGTIALSRRDALRP
jgi:hypothetical protein